MSKLKHGGESSARVTASRWPYALGPGQAPRNQERLAQGQQGGATSPQERLKLAMTPSRHEGSETDGKRGPRAKAKEKGYVGITICK